MVSGSEGRDPTDAECVAAIRAMNQAPEGVEVERALSVVGEAVDEQRLLRALWDLGWIEVDLRRSSGPGPSLVEYLRLTFEGRSVERDAPAQE